jgi:hypothetical protein
MVGDDEGIRRIRNRFEVLEDELVEIFLVEFRDLCPENSKYSLW